jgi:hypothetical protein
MASERSFEDPLDVAADLEQRLDVDADDVIARFAAAGVDVDALAARLQTEGADAFVDSWDELIANIGEKASVLTAAS